MIRYNVPFAEYLTWDYISKSGLTRFAENPAQYQWDKRFPQKATDNMLRGSAVDDLVFEGKEFFLEHYCMYKGRRDPRHKAYKEFLEKNEGKQILTETMWRQVLDIHAALRCNGLSKARLWDGESQVSATFVDPVSGETVKLRPDCISSNGHEIVDLKVTNDVSQKGFSKTLTRYKYHWQAAIYLDGINANMVDIHYDTFTFVTVKDTPLHRVEVYTLNPDDIAQGRKEYRAALCEYAKCRKSNNWPRDSGIVKPIRLQHWARSKQDEAA